MLKQMWESIAVRQRKVKRSEVRNYKTEMNRKRKLEKKREKAIVISTEIERDR